jgi:ribonuclease Y
MSFAEYPWVVGALGLAAGAVLAYGFSRWKERRARGARALQEQSLLDSARRQAEALVREARLEASEATLKARQDAEQALAARTRQVADAERRLVERETLITCQLQNLVKEESELRAKEQDYERRGEALEAQRRELEALLRRRGEEIEAIARLSQVEARELLLKETETEALRDAANLSRRIIEDSRARAEEQARRILASAVQRYAGDHTFETTTTTVTLPDEDMKGRIIGREGRNIRAFESATGVTVLIDDTPNAVVLSAFDPVRREVAREAMQRLILDGRIHPTRIEEVVARVSEEIADTIVRSGEEAVGKAGLPPLHPDIIRLLGRLRFRHSYAQNLLAHSIEVAHLAGLLAAELGLDVALAKRAGLLHDIGKAVDHEVEGAHAQIGAEVLRRYGEAEPVVSAVASHHEEVPHDGPIGIVVSAADAISASRPGARSETMTTYLKRLEQLERVGMEFPGVEKCFAVQAGRELRVLVQPEVVTDEQAYALARKISRRIEEQLQYPGQIRVTVVRETRSVEYAR